MSDSGRRKIAHLEEYQWKPGQSGNPTGRKKGIAQASREAVGDDGQALADLWWSIASDPTRRDSDRLEASRLLAERGWGKAASYNPIEGDPLGLGDLDEAAEEFTRNILRLATAGGEGQADGAGGETGPDGS